MFLHNLMFWDNQNATLYDCDFLDSQETIHFLHVSTII